MQDTLSLLTQRTYLSLIELNVYCCPTHKINSQLLRGNILYFAPRKSGAMTYCIFPLKDSQRFQQ
jgi:hypothetical protein